jgi:hypothetical protein
MAICRELADRDYTTDPSLKIGKYNVTNTLLISTPRITMMSGFMSGDSAITASLMSFSKKSAVLSSIASSKPDSSSIHCRCHV